MKNSEKKYVDAIPARKGVIYINTDKAIRLGLAIFLIGVMVDMAAFGHPVTAQKVTCASFKTQAEAQTVFDAEPALYARLDLDHDKVACEKLLIKRKTL